MLTRRLLLSAAMAAPLASLGRAAGYRTYSRCLPDYLTALAKDAYERRNKALAGLTTPEDIRARQDWARDTFWKLAGGQPERTPLNVRTLGSFDRPGYKLEKLVYESQPGLHITANLYTPTSRQAPFPGVLFQMGHSLNGKANDGYQKCCQALARLGYLVLAFDPMGQGERTYYPRAGGTLTRLSSADEEHSLPGKQLLLAGDTATRLQVWDAVRCLDVLAAHPAVDAKRLASTGQSGGGTLTMLLAAVDDRLAAAAVSCGNTENFACADFNSPGSADDAEQNFLYSGPAGFDRWDTLYPIAPKPLLVLASSRDFFGTYSPSYLTSGHEEFGKLKRVYEMLGKPEQLEWDETPLPHALSLDLRLRIYNFFERWLQGSDRKITEEPPTKPESDETLFVGRTGNVVRDFDSKTPRLLAVERANKIKPDGKRLQELIGLDPLPSAAASVAGRAAGERCTIEALDIPSAAGVSVPAWFYIPSRRSKDAVLLIMDPQGRTPRWREGDLYHQLAAQGLAVCAFDVRGIGDLSPEVGRGNPFYTRPHSEDDAYAWASLILGHPLLGQRVVDALAAVRAIRNHPAGKDRKLLLAARGKTTVPALIAASVDPEIMVYTVGGLNSYRSILDKEELDEPLANFVPSVLHHTDLPELKASLGHRLKQGAEWSVESLLALSD